MSKMRHAVRGKVLSGMRRRAGPGSQRLRQSACRGDPAPERRTRLITITARFFFPQGMRLSSGRQTGTNSVPLLRETADPYGTAGGGIRLARAFARRSASMMLSVRRQSPLRHKKASVQGFNEKPALQTINSLSAGSMSR